MLIFSILNQPRTLREQPRRLNYPDRRNLSEIRYISRRICPQLLQAAIESGAFRNIKSKPRRSLRSGMLSIILLEFREKADAAKQPEDNWEVLVPNRNATRRIDPIIRGNKLFVCQCQRHKDHWG